MVKNSMCDFMAFKRQGGREGMLRDTFVSLILFSVSSGFLTGSLSACSRTRLVFVAGRGPGDHPITSHGSIRTPCTLFTSSHAFPAEWFRSAVAFIWALARGGTLGSVLIHTHHSNPFVKLST